jgi:cell division septation protein DedD
LPDASPPEGEHRDAPTDDLAAAGAAQESVAAVVPVQYCVRIGPLRDGAAGERMRQRVAAWLPAARVEEGEAPDRSAFWVHVPPRPSDDEARAVVSALTARGVESFVIRDEPALLHGVSLGVFRDAQSAQQQMERMQGLGYPVAIHEKPRTRRAFFLLGALGPDAGAAVSPELEEAVAATASGARVAPARCDGIAPATGSD